MPLRCDRFFLPSICRCWRLPPWSGSPRLKVTEDGAPALRPWVTGYDKTAGTASAAIVISFACSSWLTRGSYLSMKSLAQPKLQKSRQQALGFGEACVNLIVHCGHGPDLVELP